MEADFSSYAWLVPVLPLIAFLVLLGLGKQMKSVGIYFSILAIFASFILSVLIMIQRLGTDVQDYKWAELEWLKVGDFSLKMGFEVTNLNALMLVIVTLVSLLVHIYSKGYMHDDERMGVFFSYIALFTFSMLGLVISENILQMYIFWELVGVCSFLLIGFWYYKPEAKAAAKKAFIVTRIGDVGLFIAILMLFVYMPNHALDFGSIHNAFANGEISVQISTWIAILIFIGAIGKSGQFPLHTWLPDAMEGPTPISALIHAATMVAAGVYLVARTYDVFLAAPLSMEVVAYVGGFTAIFAATIGLAQNDIKRILAYSTVSQLGYMMMALGLGSMTAGIFHLFTHAFFKALLFLGAGSVIHAVHTQNIFEMGGLSKKMRITTGTFAIGTLALSGIFPFAGFWSKDAILSAAYEENIFLFIIGIVAAFCTAFYMSRLYCLVFMGKSRTTSKHQVRESSSVMTFPLIILAILAVVSGFVFTPFNSWLGSWLTGTAVAEHVNWVVMILSTLVGIAGLWFGWRIYGTGKAANHAADAKVPWIVVAVQRKYYVDELYHRVIILPVKMLGKCLALFDHYIVNGLVQLSSLFIMTVGRVGSRMQNGQLQSYGLITLFGILIFIAAIVGRRLW